jgi:hypothetical protein
LDSSEEDWILLQKIEIFFRRFKSSSEESNLLQKISIFLALIEEDNFSVKTDTVRSVSLHSQ